MCTKSSHGRFPNVRMGTVQTFVWAAARGGWRSGDDGRWRHAGGLGDRTRAVGPGGADERSLTGTAVSAARRPGTVGGRPEGARAPSSDSRDRFFVTTGGDPKMAMRQEYDNRTGGKGRGEATPADEAAR